MNDMNGKKPSMVIAIGMGKGPGDMPEEMVEESMMMEDSPRMMGGGMAYAKGGSTKSSGRDGCAIRGKTKGRMC